MRRLFVWILGLCFLSAGLWAPGIVLASPPQPFTPPALPDFTPPHTVLQAPDQRSAFSQSLPALKAVLLVGPIDGDTGANTKQAKEDMELAAKALEANGVTVQRFYTPNNDWEQIKAAAQGAHFLFYRGHGVYWDNVPHVGGFSLKNKFVSNDDIRADLKLAPNAIIMLYGCFTAGTSSSDSKAISSAEAQRRVAEYSHPFLDVGAAGYYADWFGDAFQELVNYLFAGKTLGQAYESYWDYTASNVERYNHPDHPDLALWLDKDTWNNGLPNPQYNYAFVGQKDKTLADLFGGQPEPPRVKAPVMFIPLIAR
jgi:hypothetical protein